MAASRLKSFLAWTVLGSVLGSVLGGMGACSKSNPEPDRLLFYGECKVHVVSKTSGAEIFVDGVHLGEGEIKAQVPCGEKEITVAKHGYLTYREYLPTSLSAPLKVTVDLQRPTSHENYALSSLMVEQIRYGQPLDPHASKANVLAAFNKQQAELAKAPKAGKPGAAGTAASSGASSASYGTSPDDWR